MTSRTSAKRPTKMSHPVSTAVVLVLVVFIVEELVRLTLLPLADVELLLLCCCCGLIGIDAEVVMLFLALLLLLLAVTATGGDTLFAFPAKVICFFKSSIIWRQLSERNHSCSAAACSSVSSGLPSRWLT